VVLARGVAGGARHVSYSGLTALSSSRSGGAARAGSASAVQFQTVLLTARTRCTPIGCARALNIERSNCVYLTHSVY
jgi:hypothetical protein